MSDKIIILGDVHIGARNASMIIANHQLKFFEEQLFPFMIENNIDTILQTGDLFDSRKFTNHVILAEWHNRFFQKLRYYGFELHIILGNHDIGLKNTTVVNSPSLFLAQYNNIKIYEFPEKFEKNKLKMLMVPWICLDNEKTIQKELIETDCPWVMGHFEISGFEMNKGQLSEEGLPKEVFDKFEVVLSGHFHTRNTSGKIKYVGTPYEMTWIDYDDPKGFHVLDTNTLDLSFIKNNFSIFRKIYYDDKNKGVDYYKTIDVSNLEGTFVKVIVINKTDVFQFEKFMDKLYIMPLADLKVVENYSLNDEIDDEDDNMKLEDTRTLISNYIDNLDCLLYTSPSPRD